MTTTRVRAPKRTVDASVDQGSCSRHPPTLRRLRNLAPVPQRRPTRTPHSNRIGARDVSYGPSAMTSDNTNGSESGRQPTGPSDQERSQRHEPAWFVYQQLLRVFRAALPGQAGVSRTEARPRDGIPETATCFSASCSYLQPGTVPIVWPGGWHFSLPVPPPAPGPNERSA
jgi:hypothetical protein